MAPEYYATVNAISSAPVRMSSLLGGRLDYTQNVTLAQTRVLLVLSQI
jgi:hypothetical protein